MKTAVIFTGGTIASAVHDGRICVDNSRKYAVLDELPGNAGNAGNAADFVDIFEPYTILSENLDGAYLNRLLNCVQSCLDRRGIIVCHGTDTLQYAAAACAYAFGSETVPIVFVSSNYTLDDPRANGRDNFKCAYDFINGGHGSGTFIAYKNTGGTSKIHRASRVLPYAQYSDKIESLGGEYGEYINGRFVKNPRYVEAADETLPFGTVDFTAASVMRLTAYPNMVIPNTRLPILLETYHSGTAPQAVIENSVSPIYITGIEDRIQYASTRSYERQNIHILRRAAAPAMYMKLWMSLCAGRLNDINLRLAADFTD